MKGIWKLFVLFLQIFLSLKFFQNEKLEQSNASLVEHQMKMLACIKGLYRVKDVHLATQQSQSARQDALTPRETKRTAVLTS